MVWHSFMFLSALFESAHRIQAFDGVERVGQTGLIILRGAQIVGIARFVQLARELLDVFDLRVQRRHFIGGQTVRLRGQSLHDVAHFEGGFVNRAQLIVGDGFVEIGFGGFDFCPGRFGLREVGVTRHRIRRGCIGRHCIWDGFISHCGRGGVGRSRRIGRVVGAAADEGDA